MSSITTEQRRVCKEQGAPPRPVKSQEKVGIAENVRSGLQPINGLRHPPQDDTSGWYIWAGEVLSDDPDFFLPLHVEHLPEWCPAVMKFLALPPGYRFLVAGDYSDVWFDPSLLTPGRPSR